MKRSDADSASQRSYSCSETRNAVSHLQAAESLHEISVKTPTLRDYFATEALGLCFAQYLNHAEVEGFSENWRDGVAADAYLMADAMLKARG
ncbi:Uncharacterised protein [Enterobacter ludwigii]|uniref:hypothetical protein n=1 Tax=Enterobacter ludwigii TaxID=299767 RepID=UPI000797942F|nr:hypothetical protein [Enterobacter ludwigii]SAF87016.1 Uncharacterised protein [Enterobacter ludwigii]